jgi:hypothetical protein
MATFEIEVIETIAVNKLYVIEADSIEEAEQKALIGDTIEETSLTLGDVINREIAA